MTTNAAQDAQRVIPAIIRQPESQAFQEAAQRGRLLVPRCGGCGRAHWYPRALCPFCFGDDITWQEASGRATVYTYTVMRRAKPAYVIAYVTLAEGPTMMTNLVDCDVDDLRLGMPVSVSFVPAANGTLVPMFKPVR